MLPPPTGTYYDRVAPAFSAIFAVALIPAFVLAVVAKWDVLHNNSNGTSIQYRALRVIMRVALPAATVVTALSFFFGLVWQAAVLRQGKSLLYVDWETRTGLQVASAVFAMLGGVLSAVVLFGVPLIFFENEVRRMMGLFAIFIIVYNAACTIASYACTCKLLMLELEVVTTRGQPDATLAIDRQLLSWGLAEAKASLAGEVVYFMVNVVFLCAILFRSFKSRGAATLKKPMMLYATAATLQQIWLLMAIVTDGRLLYYIQSPDGTATWLGSWGWFNWANLFGYVFGPLLLVGMLYALVMFGRCAAPVFEDGVMLLRQTGAREIGKAKTDSIELDGERGFAELEARRQATFVELTGETVPR